MAPFFVFTPLYGRYHSDSENAEKPTYVFLNFPICVGFHGEQGEKFSWGEEAPQVLDQGA